MKYHIPCLYEQGKVRKDQTVSDYHPLTKQEIADLLRVAQTADPSTANSIQFRLCQGIKGQECPRPISGRVAQRESEISSLYVANFQKGADPTLVNRFYDLMTK